MSHMAQQRLPARLRLQINSPVFIRHPMHSIVDALRKYAGRLWSRVRRVGIAIITCAMQPDGLVIIQPAICMSSSLFDTRLLSTVLDLSACGEMHWLTIQCCRVVTWLCDEFDTSNTAMTIAIRQEEHISVSLIHEKTKKTSKTFNCFFFIFRFVYSVNIVIINILPTQALL